MIRLDKIENVLQIKPKKRADQIGVSNETRLHLIILVTEFHLSSRQAATIVGFRYNNVKKIMQAFKDEGIIVRRNKGTGAKDTEEHLHKLL